MKRNFQIDRMWPSMEKQMTVMWKLCEKYPSMDFYRTYRESWNQCRITIMGIDIAEVWTEERKRKQNKSIEQDFVGSVISNYITEIDRVNAVSVKDNDYSVLGDNVFGKWAYQSTWTYKWIQFAQTYDSLYNIIEHVVLTYAKETGADLYVQRGAYDKNHYRSVIEKHLDI